MSYKTMPRVICRPGFCPWFATLFFGAIVTYLCFFLHPDNQPLPQFPPTDPVRIGMIFVLYPPVLFCLMWCLIMRIEAASHGGGVAWPWRQALRPLVRCFGLSLSRGKAGRGQNR